MGNIKNKLKIIFDELFNEGIITIYQVIDNGGVFSFHNIEDSPHRIYIDKNIEIDFQEELSQEEINNGEEHIITIKIDNINRLKETIKKQSQYYGTSDLY